MKITTKNRTELKNYFLKNSIPTESNFADLINGMLNQKEDGVVKSGGALSIEAADPADPTSMKRAVSLYVSLNDDKPAWSLSLNPYGNPSDPKTARPGLSISDGADNSRLFIDGSSGNVGLGTVTPVSKLHVINKGGHGPEDANGVALTGGGIPIVAQSNSTAFALLNGDGRLAFALNVDNNAGTNNARGVTTFYDRFDGNWHPSLALKMGFVGIGSGNPSRPLTIRGTAPGNSELISFENPNGDVKWHLNMMASNGGLNIAETGVADGRLVITPGGTIGIGTTTPSKSTGLTFDGANGYYAVPTMTVDYSKGLTVEAWVLYHSFKNWSRIIDFGNGTNTDNIIFSNMGGTNNLVFETVNGSAPTTAAYSNNALDLDVWMHLAATVEPSGKVILYKNGVPLPMAVPTTVPPNNAKRTANFIGRSNWPNDGYFDGKIRDLRLWNVVRSQDEINKNLGTTLTGNISGLVASWPFDYGNRADVGPNGLTGNLINGAGWRREALTTIGGASFDGDLYVSGKILSPIFKVTRVLDNQISNIGPQPTATTFATATFASSGGTLLIFASGSGFRTLAFGAGQIGMEIFLNGMSVGTARSYSNETSSHKAFVSSAIVASAPKGFHTITLFSYSNTVADANDFFSVTVLELPV